jgi:hypothetical protein
VKFVVDAQLPARLVRFLNDVRHEALHTSELPDGNRMTDVRIAEFADSEGRVVITKDRDFRDGHLLSGSPRRLLSSRPATSRTPRCWRCSRRTSTRSSMRSARPTSSSWARRRW